MEGEGERRVEGGEGGPEAHVPGARTDCHAVEAIRGLRAEAGNEGREGGGVGVHMRNKVSRSHGQLEALPHNLA